MGQNLGTGQGSEFGAIQYPGRPCNFPETGFKIRDCPGYIRMDGHLILQIRQLFQFLEKIGIGFFYKLVAVPVAQPTAQRTELLIFFHYYCVICITRNFSVVTPC